MRLALIGLLTVVAGLAADLQAASAQESFLLSGFAREAPAATKTPGRWIVPSIPGSNASRPRADWAATAPQIRGGTGLAKSRPRKTRAVGTVRSCPLHGMTLALRRTVFLDDERRAG